MQTLMSLRSETIACRFGWSSGKPLTIEQHARLSTSPSRLIAKVALVSAVPGASFCFFVGAIVNSLKQPQTSKSFGHLVFTDIRGYPGNLKIG